MVTIGERIRELRKSKKWTQDDLAKSLGLDRTTISKWESAKTEPDIATINRLAKIFDVSGDFLLGNAKPRELPQTVAPYLPEGFDELSPEAKEEVLNYIDYIMVKYGKKDGK